MIKYLFFDFDGTISDARSIAVKSVIKTLDEFDYKYDVKKAVDLLGIKMHRILRALNIPEKDLKKVRKRFYKHFIGGAKKGQIKLCVSVKPLKEMAKEIPLIVVSNSETNFIKESIKTLKIKGLFKKIYGADKFERKDKLLKKLFKKYKIKPSEAMYIGDRFSDIEFARNAGCIAIAIYNKCSWSTLKIIKAEKPDHIIKDFYGLKKLVNKINR